MTLLSVASVKCASGGCKISPCSPSYAMVPWKLMLLIPWVVSQTLFCDLGARFPAQGLMYNLPAVGSDRPLDMSKKITRVIECYGAIFSVSVEPTRQISHPSSAFLISRSVRARIVSLRVGNQVWNCEDNVLGGKTGQKVNRLWKWSLAFSPPWVEDFPGRGQQPQLVAHLQEKRMSPFCPRKNKWWLPFRDQEWTKPLAPSSCWT